LATEQAYADYIIEQLEAAGPVRARKMFGEYAVYLGGKVVGLICNNQLFVKVTSGGQKFIGNVELAAPYSGAKPAFLIDERLEDGAWLSELITLTAHELPEPKPKKRKC